MKNVIKLEDRAALIPDFYNAPYFYGTMVAQGDATQIDEGMEILAAYRALPDESTRSSVKQLIKSLAKPNP